MNRISSLLLAAYLFGIASTRAQEPAVLHKEPVPGIQPLVVLDPVPVPETVGASLLAGVGFFMLFRRRRYH